MTTEVWLAIVSLVASGGTAIWFLVKVTIPKIVAAKLEGARDRREHQQTLEEAEANSTAAQRAANQRLTLTLNQNIIGTLERSMAEATTANEAIRDRFFGRLDLGLKHIYSELDGLRLEMRRMDANYNDLARDRHLLWMENDAHLEARLDRLAATVGRLAAVIQAAHGVDVQLPEEIGDQVDDQGSEDG